MSTTPPIRWTERGPDLLEARAVLPDGRDVYVGYIAASPGQRAWRGYVGRGFVPLGMGPRTVMQRAVEQRVADSVTCRGEGLHEAPRRVRRDTTDHAR